MRRPEPVQSAPEPPRRVDDKSDARFDGARLVALQMAVAGSTREEVHSELQRAFRLADPSSILDDVFGGPRRSGVAAELAGRLVARAVRSCALPLLTGGGPWTLEAVSTPAGTSAISAPRDDITP